MWYPPRQSGRAWKSMETLSRDSAELRATDRDAIRERVRTSTRSDSVETLGLTPDGPPGSAGDGASFP